METLFVCVSDNKYALNVAAYSQHSHDIIDFRLTEKGYSNLRFILLLSFCVLRLSLVWRHLQSYLDMAHERIEKMKKETGRITNVELQRKVTATINILLTAFFFFSFWRLHWNPGLLNLKGKRKLV